VAKLILLSCVLAILAIPIIASRSASATRGLRWTMVLFVLYNLLYVFLIRYIYPRFV
jgi:hypothetical protein